MPTLTLEFWTEGGDFCIYAEAGEYEQEIRLKGQAGVIAAQLATIYDILERREEQRAAALEAAVGALSERLIAPFAEQIRRCELVRFVAYDDLIRGAFDLLLFDGAHLFLQRPICYQVAEGAGDDEPSIELGSALLIADLTADPEQACRQVAALIPKAEYAVMEDADLSMIKDAADEVDALVVSAHGDLDDDNDGSVALNDEEIGAALVGKLAAWIVYFDACQQGVNMAFAQAFQDKSDIQFYLAPVISNDAGDSSTKTMLWFFTAVLEHRDPIRALFETRKRLFAFYRDEQRLDIVTTLNKAFAFRIYEFVDEEEAE